MPRPAADRGAGAVQLLRSLFDAAVAAAQPRLLLPGRLLPPPPGRTVVVGAGKASAAMARAVEEHWHGPLSGLVVTRYGHGVPCERIEVVEAAHPVPDERGRDAADRILALAEGLAAADLLICLVSGGGSALLALPGPGITLQDKQAVGRALLRCGAPIADINCVRKHLSAIKGGLLAAAAHPARVVTYLISDVPGDDPSMIASGPTVPDPTTFADAVAVLGRCGVDAPPAVKARLLAGAGATTLAGLADAAPDETPKPGDPQFARDEVIMLAKAADALAAATAAARSAGITPVLLGDDLQGEARELGAEHARLALACASGGGPVRPPCVLLSGGETTVTVRGDGRGGRNAEYLLSLAIALDGHPAIWAIACDTDGIDGTEDNAGAVAGPGTLAGARAAGLDPIRRLAANDAYGLFAALDGLVMTGPTRTNVNDFRAVLVLA
jgi:glycerate 2-kinase